MTVYVKIKLKRLNNRLNIRELNSAKVKDFKEDVGITQSKLIVLERLRQWTLDLIDLIIDLLIDLIID